MRIHKPVTPGERFGELTVIEDVGLVLVPARRVHRAKVRCDCGTVFEIHVGNLRRGANPKCGPKHVRRRNRGGIDRLPGYTTWVTMRSRCSNPNDQAYADYGGRGITVCERWQDFELFYTDMGPKPAGRWLERINNEKGYEPGNCKWELPKAQARNRRNNRWIEFNGEKRVLADWAELLGITSTALRYRLKCMRLEQALTTPKR